jgi:hypothetical protein
MSMKSERSVQYILMCIYCLVFRIYKYPVMARYKWAYLLDELIAKELNIFIK